MEEFSEEVYRDQLYTESQSRLLTNIPRITAPLSILGSFLIIYIILKDRKRKLKRVYHRLLLAYSCIDVLTSFNFALSALVVPRGTPGVWGARGTIATCEASGFITQFSMSQGAYGSFICLYYVLVLRYQVQEQTLAKYVEPWVHAFSFLTPLVFGTVMLWHKNYNPTNVMVGWCFINVYPMDCLRRDEVECERGAGYEPWLILNNVPVFVFWGVVMASCILTYMKVKSLEDRGARWSFSQNQSRSSERRVRETAKQAALYITAFFLNYIFFGIGTLFGPSPATEENRGFYLPIVILTKTFLPLCGVFNCFIYIRPRFTAIRLRNPDCSAWKVFKLVLADDNNAEDVSSSPMGSNNWFGSPVTALRSVARWMTRSSDDNMWPPSGLSSTPSEKIEATNRLSTSDRKSGEIIVTPTTPPTSHVQVERPNNTQHDEFIPEFDMEEVNPFDDSEDSGDMMSCEEQASELEDDQSVPLNDVETPKEATEDGDSVSAASNRTGSGNE